MDTSDTQLNSVSTPITRNEVMGKPPITTPTYYLSITTFLTHTHHHLKSRTQLYLVLTFLTTIEHFFRNNYQ